MIIIEQIYKKTDPDVKWYYENWSPEFSEYMKTNYYSNEKMQGTISPSDDNLTITILQIFMDKESKDQFDNDEYLINQRLLRDEYNLQHGIELVQSQEL